MRSQQRLFYRYFEHQTTAKVDWIGTRPARKQAMQTHQTIQAIADYGLEGDHRCTKKAGSGRQVTFISAEHIELIAKQCNTDSIDPALPRRNIVISGSNINILRHQHFRIGTAEFITGALCHPCSRMDEVLGPGGAGKMYGYGGLCAKIVKSGTFSVDDPLIILAPE